MQFRLSHNLVVGIVSVFMAAGALPGPAAAEEPLNISDVRVSSYRHVVSSDGSVQQNTLTTAATGEYTLTRYNTIGLAPITDWLGHEQVAEYIIMSGSTASEARVVLRLAALEQTVLATQANKDGVWQLTVPVDTLPAGNYHAYVQASQADQFSNELAIADFSVQLNERVSNSTWALIVVVGFSLVILLIVINVQFLFQRHVSALYTRAPDTE